MTKKHPASSTKLLKPIISMTSPFASNIGFMETPSARVEERK